MLQGLVQKAEGAVISAVRAVVWRATVAVPLIIAAGSGIAALAVTLSQAYGPPLAYTIMAGLFVAVAGLTAVIMSRKTPEAEPEAEDSLAAALRCIRLGFGIASSHVAGRDPDAMLRLLFAPWRQGVL